MSTSTNIYTIREIIDMAFGSDTKNTVNFKLIQTVMYLLARHLRILERRVEVNVGSFIDLPSSTISVTEIKVFAKVPTSETDALHGTSKKHGKVIDKKLKEDRTPGKTSAPETGSQKSSYEHVEPKKVDKVIDKKLKEDRTPGKTSAPETGSQKPLYEHVEPKKGDKSRKEVTKKVSDEKISPEQALSAKSSVEKITLGKIVSKKASDEKIVPGKVVKKKPTEKIASSKKDGKENALKVQKVPKIASIERSTSVSSELKRSNKYLMERHHTQSLLEMIEQKREKELRIIHQRADSHVETVKTPTPMASLDSAEIHFEKLLLVERLPSRDADKRISSELDIQEKAKSLALVTEDQFQKLATTVMALQKVIESYMTPLLPENAELMQGLRKGATLTEAMAVLQLSARVDALEATIGRMAGLLTDLVPKTKEGNDATSSLMPSEFNINEEEEGVKKGKTADTKSFGKDVVVLHVGAGVSSFNKAEGTDHDTKQRPGVSVTMPVTQPHQEEVYVHQWDMTGKDSYNYVTNEQFETALQEMYDNFFKAVANATAQSNQNAKNATLLAQNLEEAIDTSLGIGGRIAQLEDNVDEYAAKINNLDTGLTSQMTQYHEQLSQMQHDLESGLESMAEALANQGGETEAMTELTKHFVGFQADIDLSLSMNKDLRELQDLMGLDLEHVRKDMEVFSETKCDRDEIVDALKDKAGIKDLNGLVLIEYFEAVRGKLEKKILKSYAKFRNQEVVWQKAIDDLSKEIQDRAEIYQLESLAKDIQKNHDMLKAKIHGIEEILGEPKALAVTRRVFRDSACLSCSSPAYMDMEGPGMVPLLPPVRLPLVGAEAPSRPKEDGDHRVCYPGLPIPHALDPRAHICSRYCGGAHTTQSAQYSRMSPSMGVQHIYNPTFDLGSDGKSYMVEPEIIRKPCYPCNSPKQPSVPLATSLDEFKEPKIGDTAEGPSGFCPCCLQHQKQAPKRESYDRGKSSLSEPLDLQSQENQSATTPVLYDYD